MKRNESLTAGQRRFTAAMLEAKSIRQACELADISEATAWRYLQAAPVKAELARLSDAMLAQAATGLLSDLALARQTLRNIMLSDASDSARVSAARAVLDAALRLFELASLSERVANLEEKVIGGKNDGA